MRTRLQKDYSAFGFAAVTIPFWTATPLLISRLSLSIPVFC